GDPLAVDVALAPVTQKPTVIVDRLRAIAALLVDLSEEVQAPDEFERRADAASPGVDDALKVCGGGGSIAGAQFGAAKREPYAGVGKGADAKAGCQNRLSGGKLGDRARGIVPLEGEHSRELMDAPLFAPARQQIGA